MTPVWDYSWKTPDGIRHEGVLSAPTKDAVYRTLNARGIRPIKVAERIVVKGGLKSLRKRDWTVFALIFALALAAVWFFARPRPAPPATSQDAPPAVARDLSLARHSLPRRPIPDFASLDLAALFSHPSESFLAAFAVPGRTDRLPAMTDAIAADFFDAFADDLAVAESDAPPVAVLKRIVIGLKREAEAFLESGKSADDLARWLVTRQRMEDSFRLELAEKVRASSLSRDEANVILRNAGLEELP